MRKQPKPKRERIKIEALKFSMDSEVFEPEGHATDDQYELWRHASSIHKILRLADSQNDSRRALLASSLLIDAVARLTDIAGRKPELFSQDAASRDCWPVLFNLRPEATQNAQNLVRKLGICKDHAFKMGAEHRSLLSNTFTDTARKLMSFVDGQRHQMLNVAALGLEVDTASLSPWTLAAGNLPELSKATFDEWWPVLLEAFNEGCPEPEKNESLMKALGVGKHYAPASKIRNLIKRRAENLLV